MIKTMHFRFLKDFLEDIAHWTQAVPVCTVWTLAKGKRGRVAEVNMLMTGMVMVKLNKNNKKKKERVDCIVK